MAANPAENLPDPEPRASEPEVDGDMSSILGGSLLQLPLESSNIELSPATEGFLASDDVQALLAAGQKNGFINSEPLEDLMLEHELSAEDQESIWRYFEEHEIDLVIAAAIPAAKKTYVDKSETSTDALQLFLREASRYPLLTAQEEVELDRQKQKYMPYRDAIKEANVGKHLSQGEMHDLLVKITNQDVEAGWLSLEEQQAIYDGEKAFDKLLNSNLRLVVSIAKRYRNQGLDFLDLISEGVVGLHRAVEKFDWHRGYKFSTYATWWIRQSVTRALADKSRTIRMPVHVVERLQKMNRAERKLWMELKREPTPEEVADEAHLTLDQVKEVRSAAQVTASLDQPVGEQEESVLGDFMTDDQPPPEDEASANLARQQIREMLESIKDERAVKVLKLRFGFDGEPKTLEEIGRTLGITRERVRQIETNALQKLADIKEFKELRDAL